MAIEVSNIPNSSNITTYTVSEEATPEDPAIVSGLYGEISVTREDFKDSLLYLEEPIEITDGTRGKTSGNVTSVNKADRLVTLTADSIMGLFNADRSVKPFKGTFGQAITYYASLVGFNYAIDIETSLADMLVEYPGWNGNVWEHLKQILSVEKAEATIVFSRLLIRKQRSNVASLDHVIELNESIDNQSAARTIEVYYYNNNWGTNVEVFPVPSQEASVQSVEANETITFEIKLDASLETVNQPIATLFVNNQDYSGTQGVYSIVGNDNLPVTPAQWLATGGSLTVTMTDDPSVLEVTVTGMNNTVLSPFRIAMSSGNNYNSLHITGTGIRWNKEKLTLVTGAKASTTAQEVGVTVDNPFISTLEQAYSGGMITNSRYSGSNYVLSGRATDINRTIGQGNEFDGATINDFNLVTPSGTPISTFNTEWSGDTIEDFNSYWLGQFEGTFPNQAFGNAAGAIVRIGDSNFRIQQTTFTEGELSFSSVASNTIEDFNLAHAGQTVADFNNIYAGMKMKDFNVIPLREVAL